jgi:hypothetical protein
MTSSSAFSACGLELLGGDSRRMLATFATLYREASQGLWPGGELDVLLAEATRLCDGGDVDAAARCYEQAQMLASEHAPDRLLDVATDWAAYADKFGQPVHGAELNLAVLEDPIAGADLWTRVRCLTHASMLFLAAADHTRALDCITQARPLWEGMGHRRAAALSTGIEAETLRRSGQRENARTLIESVKIEPAGAYEGDILEYRSRIRFDHSDFEAAGAEEPLPDLSPIGPACAWMLCSAGCLQQSVTLPHGGTTKPSTPAARQTGSPLRYTTSSRGLRLQRCSSAMITPQGR